MVAAYCAAGDEIWAVVPETEMRQGHPVLMGRTMIELFLRGQKWSAADEIVSANREHVRTVKIADPRRARVRLLRLGKRPGISSGATEYHRYNFPTLSIQESFVLSHSSPSLNAVQFVQQVLATRPAIAVFDCDGTLWSGDAGADFFYWEMNEDSLHRRLFRQSTIATTSTWRDEWMSWQSAER